jgi:uncharacterized membrane protein YjjP (DUF1212 family)
VNTDKLSKIENFVNEFSEKGVKMSIQQIHNTLDEIQNTHGNYSPVLVGLASGFACSAFAFLLGGGPIEMIGAFLGAGIGNFIRRKLGDHHISLLACISISVALACIIYAIFMNCAEMIIGVSQKHEVGYICAILFVIPGFPFITSGIDMSKLDMRSGIERLSYSLMVIIVATCVAWVTALVLGFTPGDFSPLGLDPIILGILRFCASFIGVFGFSIMFNSPRKMATIAGIIGAITNTLRLELIDFTNIPVAAAAFIGAFIAGILASIIKKKIAYPRITLTIPSIVIMVPGLYMYRAIYSIGIMDISAGALWIAKATLIVLALPLGLIFARMITDKKFRYCS